MPSKYEEQYFINVYKESYTSILSYVTSKCSDPSDIEDLVQEVYTEFYSRIRKHGFSDLDNPGGLLMTITKRKLVRYYKEKKESFETLNDIIDLSEDEESATADVSALENHVINKIVLEKLWNEMAFEGNTVLLIFKMRHYKDMTFKQIAAKLGLSETTVANHYFKTLYKIKKKYTEKENA